jgi:hypothetical protein
MTDLIVYFNSLKMQLFEKLIDYQKYFQFDENISFLFENDDHSSNQRDRFQKRIERNCAFDRKNRVCFEAYQKDQKKMINEFKTHRFQFYERDRFDVIDASQRAIQSNNRSENRDRKKFRKRNRDRDRENFNFN